MVIDRITRLRLVKTSNEPIVNTALKNGVKLLNKKVHFCCAVFWSKKGVLGEHSCPAELDPASHPIRYFC